MANSRSQMTENCLAMTAIRQRTVALLAVLLLLTIKINGNTGLGQQAAVLLVLQRRS